MRYRSACKKTCGTSMLLNESASPLCDLRIDGTYFPLSEAIPKCLLDTGRTTTRTFKIKITATTCAFNQKAPLSARTCQKKQMVSKQERARQTAYTADHPTVSSDTSYNVGEQYLASQQRFDDTGADGSLHNLIQTNHRRPRKGRRQCGIRLGYHPVSDGSNADRGPLLTIHAEIPPIE